MICELLTKVHKDIYINSSGQYIYNGQNVDIYTVRHLIKIDMYLSHDYIP